MMHNQNFVVQLQTPGVVPYPLNRRISVILSPADFNRWCPVLLSARFILSSYNFNSFCGAVRTHKLHRKTAAAKQAKIDQCGFIFSNDWWSVKCGGIVFCNAFNA